jgi:hypothetical protein
LSTVVATQQLTDPFTGGGWGGQSAAHGVQCT